jgi:signal transduction histidine kinase
MFLIRIKSMRSAARALVAITGLCLAVAPAHAEEREARVLVLNGADPYLPAYLTIDNAMRANLADEAARRIVYFSEPLDAQRFSMRAVEPEFLALLTKKYRALRIDVVVAVSQPAVDFFSRHGEKLWPGARLVFHSVPRPSLEALKLPPDAIGVVARRDFAGTIDIARRLQPQAHRILVVSGVSELDLQLEGQAREVLAGGAGPASVEFLSGWPLPMLGSRVASEPAADTIVFYLSQFRDRDARPYTPREVLRAIGGASAAPVYGVFESFVGLGAAAGSVESFEETGRLIAEQVRAALAGGPPEPGRAVLEVPSRCIADARALRRWSLDERRLPEGCEIRFADHPLWRQYLWQIAAVFAVIVAQGLLIAALYIQHRRRRVAEEAVQQQRSELAHASRLAVAGELTAAIAHEINQPLGAILSNVEAADLLLQSGEDRRDLLRQILADVRRDDLRASEVIRRLRALLAKHETEQEPFDLNAAATEVAALLRAEAERRRVTIEMRLAPVATVTGDRTQVQQVLINLLLNAMDAVSDAGEDRRAIIVAAENAGDRIRIAVRDRGQGIAAEELPKLFESFYSTKRAGMGLGLSIARTIMEAHGGRIWAESRPGDGAVFHIEFPAMERPAERPRGAVA